MHLEILVEDSSGKRLLGAVVPKVLGPFADPHTWRIIAYKGVGELPKGLKGETDPTKRILLDRLPRLLEGYGRTPGIDGVMVVVDADRRECGSFLDELKALSARLSSAPNVVFRLAIEELEAWYFGDRTALLTAYPKARREVLDRYVQDSVCGTWEMLADAIHPGGAAAVKRAGFPSSGEVKHAWAERIGFLMDPDVNGSPSFRKLRESLVRFAGRPPSGATGAVKPSNGSGR